MADAAWPDDALEVGRIAEAWGLKGWFRVQPYSSEPEALLSSRSWYLRPDEGAAPSRPKAEGFRILRIREVREHGDGLVAAAHGIDDRNAAESLGGTRVFIGRSAFPAPAADEFYWADLIGLSVENRSGEVLGTVAGLIDTGPQSVLRVQPTAGPAGASAEAAERLIPFVAAYVDSVDLAARRITVDWRADY